MTEQIAIVAFTEAGGELAGRIRGTIGGTVFTSGEEGFSLSGWTAEHFPTCDALIFVGAAGIAVRAIAPHVRHKAQDPAVIVADECGHYVIPILSGHLGGANALARRIAEAIGAEAVITTATDLRGAFAVDLWAKEHGMTVRQPERIKRVSAKALAGEEIVIRCPRDISGELPAGVRWTREEKSPDVIISCRPETCDALQLIPRILALGIGCRRGVTAEQLEEVFSRFCRERRILPESIGAAASVDRKSDEPGLLAFCEHHGWSVTFYTPDELRRAEGEFASSAFVEQTVGVDNVCERSAVLAAGRCPDLSKGWREQDGIFGEVPCPANVVEKKYAGDGVTFAVAGTGETIK